jgi:hypothetical protein
MRRMACKSIAIANPVGKDARERFDGMGHCVHGSGDGKALGHGDCATRIKNGNIGMIRVATIKSLRLAP